MLNSVVLISCCLLLPMNSGSERSLVSELAPDDLSLSVPLHTDIGSKRNPVHHQFHKSAVAVGDFGNQHQYPSTERSATTTVIDTGMYSVRPPPQKVANWMICR
jgi:hypothetical protein